MDTQIVHNIEISKHAADRNSKGTGEMPGALLQMNKIPAEDQSQPQPLGSLAQIVRKTLGLTVEEAQQMAKDLGFQKS